MNEFRNELRRVIPRSLDLSNVVFVCIGTDRSTGDSLGPYVGTLLTRLGYMNVIGTLDFTCNAENLEDEIRNIPSEKKIIAIDACLGRHTSIGITKARRGPIKPGAGVNKDLPLVGDYHIEGIVNVGGFMEFMVLQNTRLSLVVNMAEQIVDAITHVFPPVVSSYAAAGRESG